MSKKHFTTNTTLTSWRHRPGERAQAIGVQAKVDVEIDLDALFAVLGNKALKNKSRTAKEIGGLVVVTVKEL